MTTRLIVACGSRAWTNTSAIRDTLAEHLPPDDQWFVPTILHGGARGADKMVAAEALNLGFVVEELLADWAKGKSAGIQRNLAMLDRDPDLVIAFWDGKSRGTRHTIDEARRRGIECHVVEMP